MTIVILLILATISIQSLMHTGLFESANKAKLETKRGQIRMARSKIIRRADEKSNRDSRRSNNCYQK